MPYGDTFALVGGSLDTLPLDTIQMFDPDTLTFSVVEDNLTVGRQGAAVILVDESSFPEC